MIEDPMFYLIIFAIIFLFLFNYSYENYYRIYRIKKFAKKNNFQFKREKEEIKENQENWENQSQILKTTSKRTPTYKQNIISGYKYGYNWKIFDYNYNNYGFKGGSNLRKIEFEVNLNNLDFPNFFLTRKDFGMNSKIILNENIEFSKKYILSTKENEQKIKEFFTIDKIKFFENNLIDWRTEINVKKNYFSYKIQENFRTSDIDYYDEVMKTIVKMIETLKK